MGSKFCCSCATEKPTSEFNKCSSHKDGLAARCKPCDRAASKLWRKANRERAAESVARWKSTYRDRVKELNAASKKRCRENNTVLQRQRAQRIAQATPDWLTEAQKAEIKKTYELAKMMREDTGIPYEVDHMHAISGPNFCGLNVPWNLQITTAAANLAKGRNLPSFHSHLAWGG